MKVLFTGLLLAATVFTACNNEANNDTQNNNDTDTTSSNSNPTSTSQPVANVKPVIDHYLELQQALASDNSEKAATAGKNLVTAANQIEDGSFSTEQKAVWTEVKSDLTEHAEHIGDNAGKIDHQREHFDMLSRDVYDIAKVVKSSQTLYQARCPMYNDGKGATWLSEDTTIRNPYYGKKMLTCGDIKDTIKR